MIEHLHDDPHALPGQGLRAGRMPGHWLLARLGKRVLRPGGMELTRLMLGRLAIGPQDAVVEFAPGLGVTTKITLLRNPKTYTAVEQDKAAARHVEALLTRPSDRCVQGGAEQTALPAASASVVYGEAMLSMQPHPVKQRIIQEAARIMKPGARYGIHEVCLYPEDIGQDVQERIKRELTEEIRVGVRPLTLPEWRALLEEAGLTIETVETAPFHLLEPRRLIRDEGIVNTLRIVLRALRDREARTRALGMRQILRKHAAHIAAVMIVASKPA